MLQQIGIIILSFCVKLCREATLSYYLKEEIKCSQYVHTATTSSLSSSSSSSSSSSHCRCCRCHRLPPPPPTPPPPPPPPPYRQHHHSTRHDYSSHIKLFPVILSSVSGPQRSLWRTIPKEDASL